jgi:hypothetical protein
MPEQAAGELLVALNGDAGLTLRPIVAIERSGRYPRLLWALGRADATGFPTTTSGPSTRPPNRHH